FRAIAAIDLAAVLTAPALAAVTANAAIGLDRQRAKRVDAQPQIQIHPLAAARTRRTVATGATIVAILGGILAIDPRRASRTGSTAAIDHDTLTDGCLFGIHTPAADTGREGDAGVITQGQMVEPQIALAGGNRVGLPGRNRQIGGQGRAGSHAQRSQ